MKLRTLLGLFVFTITTTLAVSPALASLLGVTPSYPSIVFGSGNTAFDGTTLTITASPLAIRLNSANPPRPIIPAGGIEVVQINAQLDESCGLVGGIAGDDLVIFGAVDLDGSGPEPAIIGTLLTGEIEEVGFLDSGVGSFTDLYDFRFYITGGLLASYYTDNDLGIAVTSDNSTFAGTCSVAFQGDAKGTAGAIPPILPADGCTPGYWKQKHHFDSWVDYSPTDSFDAVFGVSGVGGTLQNALKAKGRGINALLRHTVASLLNAVNPDVNAVAYPTPAAVIAAFQGAYASGDYETQKDLFEEANEAGCPLN